MQNLETESAPLTGQKKGSRSLWWTVGIVGALVVVGVVAAVVTQQGKVSGQVTASMADPLGVLGDTAPTQSTTVQHKAELVPESEDEQVVLDADMEPQDLVTDGVDKDAEYDEKYTDFDGDDDKSVKKFLAAKGMKVTGDSRRVCHRVCHRVCRRVCRMVRQRRWRWKYYTRCYVRRYRVRTSSSSDGARYRTVRHCRRLRRRQYYYVNVRVCRPRCTNACRNVCRGSSS